MPKRFWLVKSEPDVYSLDDLERDGSTPWEGVRNYQARNNLRAMNTGDEVLYYHSNAAPPCVVGVARVCREAYDDTDPRWSLVDLAFAVRLPRAVSLEDIKAQRSLSGMELVRNSRLSVQPVTKAQFERVKKMGGLE
ncbi:MAG: EVE domain-containing protein [Gemmatimonadetes bacterium]|nr:EVE domain-containing protein [Gemmatimonadota bacterium]